MYLGAYQLGDRLGVAVLCRSSALAPVLPDSAPTATVYDASGNVVATVKVPPIDRPGSPGLFGQALHLDGRFLVGRYAVRFAWTVGSASRASVSVFDVIQGGNADGAVIALYHYHCPHAEFLIQELDSRKLVKGRNPSV